jgi:hypothetical protein
MAVALHMPVGMVVIVRMGTGHQKMLYYNITYVYGADFQRFLRLTASRSPWRSGGQ